VVAEDLVDQRAVGDVTRVEDPVAGELGPAGGQVVENDRCDPTVEAGRGDRTADEAGATRDENLHRQNLTEHPPHASPAVFRMTGYR
jgi:hypothetical protein